MTNIYYIASTYGAGSYDSSSYNGSAAGTTTSTGGNAGGSSAGALTDTGIAIAFIVTLASVVLLTALVVRIWKRPSVNQR